MIAAIFSGLFALSVLCQTLVGPIIEQSVEHNVLVVRHGPAPVASSETIVAKLTPSTTAETLDPRDIQVINEVSDLGLLTIRAKVSDPRPSWTYKPKTFQGYHPKPEWSYHGRAGWNYDAASGWRYRREPDWALQPGAVQKLLRELPTQGQTWYITRWQ